MIIIGSHLSGPELCDKIVGKTITAIRKAEMELNGDFKEGYIPAVNVVYCVAGSLGEPDWDHGQLGKYSTKKNVVVVQVAVPPEIATSAAPFDYLIDELHGANALAFGFYEQKKMEYPLREATELVNRIKELAAARLEAQGPPVTAPVQGRSSSPWSLGPSVQSGRPVARRHQLVLQWPSSSIVDFDMMVSIENALIERLSPEHEVDGHDFGSGTMNIFIRTDDARRAFEEAREILSRHSYWKEVRAGFNTESEADYTPLWPEWLVEFKVM